MEILLRAFSSIGVLLVLILGVVWFKHIGLLKEEHGSLCSALVTRVTLPAVILLTLTHAELRWDYGKMNVLLLGASFVCLGLGWLIAKAFRLEGPATCAVILTAGFSSSSVLGVPLIGDLFPATRQLVVDTVVISTLGMAPMVITAGTLIALYYGAYELTPRERLKETLAYFRSPIFVALVVGILLGTLTDHENSFVHSMVDGLRVVSAGNTLMILLTVGLFMSLQDLKGFVGLALCVAFVNLIVTPMLTMPPAHAMNLDHWKIEVLALEGAMPAASIAVVLCDAYGADARLAAKLILVTIAASVFTIPAIFVVSGLL